MKKLILWWALVQAGWLFGESSAAVPAALDADTALAQVREGLIESFRKGDIERLISYLDANVVATWQNGEVTRGQEAVRAYYNKMMTGEGRVVREIKAEPEVIGRHLYGDTAVSWGNLHDHFVLMDGSNLPLNTLFTITVTRRADRWLVTGYHASVNAFDNPVLNLAVKKTAMWSALVGMVVGCLLTFVSIKILKPKSAAMT